MVKIKDCAQTQPHAQVSSYRRFTELADITKELCNGREIVYVEPKVAISIDLRISECQSVGGILIIPDLNSVIVYNRANYNLALRLAEGYEQKTKEEFTLEKKF